MTHYILDTDHVSLSQREHPIVLQRMATIGNNHLATTVITVEEQIQGRFAVIKRAISGEKLVWAYQDLQNTLGYFTTMSLLPFTTIANGHYERLRRQPIRIGTQDLKIAAITLTVNGTLVTRNWKDFQRVPGLSLEDWSQPQKSSINTPASPKNLPTPPYNVPALRRGPGGRSLQRLPTARRGCRAGSFQRSVGWLRRGDRR